MNIKKALISGTFWTAIGRYSQIVIQIIVTAILARLLEPEAFGVLSMVVIYTGFVTLLSQSGITPTVVQKQSLNDDDLSTVFWVATILSAILTLLTVFIAPVIESFFSYNGLAHVVQVMSITLMFVGMAAVPDGRLKRKLRFREIAAVDIASAFFSGLFAIFLAFQGVGYWALVIQNVSMQGIRLISLFILNKWIPKFRFQFWVLREIFSYSGFTLGFTSINYWARNADNLLIGKVLGADPLGYYNQAYKLMMLPIRLVTSVVTPALHPVFASIQNDKERMGRGYFQVLEIIALISLPLGVFFSLKPSRLY